ncbi:MAG: response regulator [Candidatus Omnitrophica bacterium]|nr:response regulator [Candidatus Omnitrophota bacterium]MDD5437344.1 response regulator [Candidatus Omnitrophota bacterium]
MVKKPKAAKVKVLMIDDERDFLTVLSERLGAKGFDIVKAFNGREGLEKVYSEKPDIIVLDLMMPEMNGYDVCRKLKIDKTYKDIPVIMLTGKFHPDDIEFGKEMGADAYLTKPLDLELLLHKIKAFLRLKRIKKASL